MKKITLTMIAVFALCGVSMAQTRGERGTRGNQQHNPEMMAERMTDRMAKEYELDDKQKAELLELNKEFAGKTEMPRMRPHRQGRPQAKAQANPQGRRGFAAQPQRPMGERKELTDEWKKHGIEEGPQFAILTDIIYKAWAGKSAKEYKQFKGLKKENLRDNMTNRELVLNMLAEVSTKDISEETDPETFSDHMDVARRGGNVARTAREQLEKELGHSVISPDNAKSLANTDLPELDFEK